jgi:tRNA A-37 threonylcarbamoyl transferase component Bud32/WD40 repeat protein
LPPHPEPPPDAAEEAFAQFLERVEAGAPVDFAAFCAEHAALAPELQRLHRRWLAMTRAFGALSESGPAAPAPPSVAIDALLSRLGDGSRADRYALGAEIARGGMGRIVQAWDAELRREVALKIHRGDPADVRQRRRFLEEAQIAAQLDHPGIVPVHELGLDAAGRPFFSMQLVRGSDLGRILELARDGRDGWNRTRVLHVLLRACEAVAYAHSKGVVHRDLKPQNIMVGAFHETYVMDWGLARVAGATADGPAADVDTLRAAIADEDRSSPLLTGRGDVLGTPAYMAPEQAAAGTADVTVDVYAIGAILYHLLAGHMPYATADRPTAEQVLARLAAGPPTRLGDDIPAELRAICERAMARDPAARYPGIAALADDLRAYLEVRTVRAYATGRFAELRKWVARNRALTASVAALLLALVGGATAVTALWVRAERNRDRADATAAHLQTELDRRTFRSARQSLQLEDSSEAGDALWRTHLAGSMPRATTWALVELAERDPYLVTLPVHANLHPVAFAAPLDAVLVGTREGRLEVRDATSLALRRTLGTAGPPLLSLVAAADASWAAAGNTRGELLVFDLAGGQVVRRLTAHRGSLRCLCPLGAGFASSGADGAVLAWPRPDAAPHRLLELAQGVTALATMPDGQGVVAGDELGGVHGARLDGAPWPAIGVGARITALAFGADPDDLWIGSTDHWLRRRNQVDPTRNREFPTRNGSCRQLARDQDGSLLAGGWWRTDRIGNDGVARPPVALRGISRFAFDPAARRLVSTGIVSGLGLVDVSTRDRRPLPDCGALALSADGRRCATIQRQRVVVADVDSGETVARLPGEFADDACLDAAGAAVAVAAADRGSVHVFTTATGARRYTIDDGDAAVGWPAVFAPDGSELALTVGHDRVRRVRAADGALLGEHALPAMPLSLAYGRDGTELFAIVRNQAVVHVCRLPDGQQRQIVFTPVLPTGVPTTLSALAVSPDGARVAVGTWQGGILVRERDGRTTEIAAHAGTIWQLQFAGNDPGLLISSGGAAGIAFWDLDSGECCYQPVRDLAARFAVSDDCRTLLCAQPDGALLLDLAYRRRHLAGNLAYHLDRQRGRVVLPPGREQTLQREAEAVLAAPWPRWR